MSSESRTCRERPNLQPKGELSPGPAARGGTPLPCLSLNTATLPPEQRLAAWQAAIPNYDVLPLGEDKAEFGVSAQAWLLGELVVAHTSVSGVAFARPRARIQTDGADTYHLHILLRGSWSGDVDGQALTVGPGQLVGFDLTRPFAIESEPSESVSVVIGRRQLQDVVRCEPDLHGHVFEGAAGLLLSDHCIALARHLPVATTGDAVAIVRATLALVAGALPTMPASPTMRAVGTTRVRHAVRRHIERHLGAPDLGPEAICGALGLSRSTLYDSFQALGGVATYIQRRRLQAVRALLLHPGETRTIRDIAQALGFTSSSHFAAAFRREFGCSPSELRATQRMPMDPTNAASDVASQFRAWSVRHLAK